MDLRALRLHLRNADAPMTTERHEARVRLLAGMLVSAIGLPLVSISIISIPVVTTLRSLLGASLLETAAATLFAATVAGLGIVAWFAGVRLKVVPFRMMELRQRYLRLGARTSVVVFAVYGLLALAAHFGFMLGWAQMQFARILLTAGALLAVAVADGAFRLLRRQDEFIRAVEASEESETPSRDDRITEDLRRLIFPR